MARAYLKANYMKSLLTLLPLFFTASVFAQNDSVTQHANTVTDIFMKTCMTNFGNNKAASAWAQKNNFSPANEKFAKKILHNEPGEVWGLSGKFLVVLSGASNCSTWAKTADAEQVNKNFERLIKGVARPGLTVKPLIDKTSDGVGGKYRQYGFTIQKDGASHGVAVLSTTSESNQAEIQARLTLSQVKL